MNYQHTQHVSIGESLVPYFRNHGAKQYIHSKPIKVGFKLWVKATPLRYCVQFRSYAGKDSILQKYENIGLGLGASVVANLVSKLPVMQTSNYHFVVDNYFTSPALLRHLSAIGVAATGTVRANRMHNAPLRDMVKMNKEKYGSSDVITDVFSNITAVRWKDNKVVNTISTFTGNQPIQQVKRYCHREKRRVNFEQPNIINQHNMSMRGVDHMDQNISVYMINLRPKQWWWPLFRFVIDVAVSNAYQIFRPPHLNPGKYRLDVLGFRRAIVDAHYHLCRKSLPSTTLFTGSRS